jgi:nucleotide-binding universal stress UspA family protein
MKTATDPAAEGSAPGSATVTRIAVGVDGFPEGNDAVVLGMALARATGAELMLVAVHSDPLVLPPMGASWKSMREEAHATLRKARAALAPESRLVVETDLSIPRALQRVVHRERRDLLVMGSSRHAPEGKVRIGKRTRQLLCRFECPLAVAPRGFRNRPEPGFKRIGVGYDGGAESQAALELAGSIAIGAGAQLLVQAVVDDRMPPIGWSGLPKGGAELARWEDAVVDETDRRRTEAEAAAVATGASGDIDVGRGRPADALLEISRDVDLLVIGSRRWGPVSRLLLGSTGEALLHDAACPVLVVPRPPA